MSDITLFANICKYNACTSPGIVEHAVAFAVKSCQISLCLMEDADCASVVAVDGIKQSTHPVLVRLVRADADLQQSFDASWLISLRGNMHWRHA